VDTEQYTKEREKLLDFQLNQAGMFDRAILTLSAAALGLSLTFTEKFSTGQNPEFSQLLYISWFCFVLSLLATLSSFQLSQKSLRRGIDIIDEAHAQKKDCSNERNDWARITDFANWVSLLSFIAGASLLTLFAVFNM